MLQLYGCGFWNWNGERRQILESHLGWEPDWLDRLVSRRTPPEALRGHQSQEACGLTYWKGLRCGVIGSKAFPSSKASLSAWADLRC